MRGEKPLRKLSSERTTGCRSCDSGVGDSTIEISGGPNPLTIVASSAIAFQLSVFLQKKKIYI